jgi:Transposase DDE domain group 1
MLEPIVERYRSRSGVRLLYRADAAFAKPEVYEYLEQRGIGYAIRLSANEVLQREIEPLLQPPIEEVLEQPIVRYHVFLY